MSGMRWLVGVVAAAVTLGAQGLPKITPDLARRAVGQLVTICGDVGGVECWAGRERAPVIQVGQRATVCGDVGGFECWAGRERALVLRTPSEGPAFEIALDRVDVASLGGPVGDRYFGQHACATGAVEATPNGYRMRIAAVDQLQIARPNAEATGLAEGVLWCPGLRQLPKVIREVKPQYTYGAMKARIEGRVTITAIVGTDGLVSHALVKRSLHTEMDESALRAVREWRFEPGTRDGKPVPTSVWIDLTFTLRE